MSDRGHLLVVATLVLLCIPDFWLQFFARASLVLLVISWLLAWWQRRSTVVVPEFTTLRIFAHDRDRIRLRVQNRGFLPIPLVAVKDENHGLHIDGRAAESFNLPPFSQVTVEYEIWHEQRGVYAVGPTQILGMDPVGLFPWEATQGKRRWIIVYPRVNEVDLMTLAGVPGYTNHSQRLEHADRQEPRGLRPYEGGDDPRDIHWKASARAGALLVNKPQLRQEISLIIILNLATADYHQKRQQSHVERCIEAAAAACVFAANREYQIELFTNGQLAEIVPEAHDATIPRLLETLAVVQSNPTATPIGQFAAGLRFANRPHVLLISPPLNAEAVSQIEHLRPAMRSLVWWVLDEQVERESRVGLDLGADHPAIVTYKLHPYSDELELMGARND